MKVRNILFALIAICCIVACVSVYLYFQYSSALLDKNAHVEHQRNAELVGSKLDVFLASHKRAVETAAGLPGLKAYMMDPTSERESMGRLLLDLICNTEAASICYLMNLEGTIVTHNSDVGERVLKGKNFAFRPYFTQALEGKSTVYAAFGLTTRKRGVYISQLLQDSTGASLGVAVIKLPAEALDEALASEKGNLMLVDPNEIVFAASNPAWLLKSLWPLSEQSQLDVLASRQFGDTRIESLEFKKLEEEGHIQAGSHEFLMERAPLEQLPGWDVVYLGEGPSPMLFFAGRTMTVVVTILSVLGALVMGVLFFFSRRDDMQLEAAEEELVSREQRLRQLGEISNEGIVIHAKGQIRDVNGVAERMFGYERDEMLQMEVWDLLAPESISIGFHNVHTGVEVPYEVNALRKDGSEFPMEVFAKNSFVDDEDIRVACLRDITEFKQQEETIRYQAQFDMLTDLPNKQLFVERLKRALEHARESRREVAVLYIDLDDFKKINDSMGHETGDQLLIEVAHRLLNITRIGDTLARYGADEYVMLLDEVNTETEAPRIAEAILRELEREFDIDGRRFYISGTVGISVYPQDGHDEVSLLQHADVAMHRCKKENSGNSYGFYQSAMTEDAAVRIEMERYLRRAISRNELILNYQPIFGTDDRRFLGAEVLVRWQSKDLGLVGPDHFIPLAEQTGLIIEMGHWILRTACEQGRKWMDEGLKDFYLAVNISPRQLRNQDFVGLLETVLEETGFPAQNLVLELTEGLLVRKDAGTAEQLDALKEMGVMLSMDDFGTGYSSLAYLKMFPFDVIKIDRSFVRDLVVDTSDQQLIVAAIEMAKALGLKVVAEGVETAQQLHFLRDAGCYSVQGYYLSKPIDAQVFHKEIVAPRIGKKELPVSG